jgi:DNA-binding transcriptional LysR family regulator
LHYCSGNLNKKAQKSVLINQKIKYMKQARTTWEQWQVLQCIVSEGGFAQAAKAMHRSQSSVSYMVAQLQEQLGVALLQAQGRRMVLTAAGEVLLRDAQNVLAASLRLEDKARSLLQGWEAEVRLAVDSLFPTPALLPALGQFASHCPSTRLQMHEVVMSGADDALHGQQVELAVAGRVPQGFLGDWLLDAEFVACAAPGIPCTGWGGRWKWKICSSMCRWCCAIPVSASRAMKAGWVPGSAGRCRNRKPPSQLSSRVLPLAGWPGTALPMVWRPGDCSHCRWRMGVCARRHCI